MLWGKSTWMLFHTIVERVDEQQYKTYKGQILSMIKHICNNLPCPECTEHAGRFINKVRIESVPTKQSMKLMLYQFHNQVNRRVRNSQFNMKDLDIYKKYNIGIVIQNFLTFYAKRYDGTLQGGRLSTELTRKRIANSVREWMRNNYKIFI